MSLADVWDDTGPGKYLQPGWHEVTVTDCQVHQRFHSGNDGLDVTVEDAAGAKSKAGFVLKPTVYWKLASFAKACGFTREQAEKYDPDRESCHRMLLRKRLKVHVVKKGDYHEVDDWAGLNESVAEKSTNPQVQRPEEPQPAAPTGKEIPF
jgi:hypothetical protein